MDAKHIINATVENQPAVLSRIVGLFSGRGYNIETLNVGPCADPRFSRMTITVPGDEHVLEQVLKQLNKLVDVVKVVDLTAEKHIARELVLVEVGAPKLKRPEVTGIADLFGAEVVGVAVLVDRSGGTVSFDVPVFKSALKLSLPTFDPAECPLCKQGLPVDRPGSK